MSKVAEEKRLESLEKYAEHLDDTATVEGLKNTYLYEVKLAESNPNKVAVTFFSENRELLTRPDMRKKLSAIASKEAAAKGYNVGGVDWFQAYPAPVNVNFNISDRLISGEEKVVGWITRCYLNRLPML